MARKKKHEEHVNHERWLVSYADFITLLFAFFVVMFAVSQVDSKKVGRFTESVQAATRWGIFERSGPPGAPLADLGFQGSPTTTAAQGSPRRNGQGGDRKTEGLDAIRRSIELRLGSSIRAGRTQVVRNDDELVVRLRDAVFFDSGSATLLTDALPDLAAVRDSIAELPNEVRIEGHTDSQPVRNNTYRSNWDLSAARAASVLDFFVQDSRIAPSRVSIAGYSDQRPIADNDTDAGRRQNRRVDVVILTQRHAGPQSSADAPAGPVAERDGAGGAAEQGGAVEARGSTAVAAPPAEPRQAGEAAAGSVVEERAAGSAAGLPFPVRFELHEPLPGDAEEAGAAHGATGTEAAREPRGAPAHEQAAPSHGSEHEATKSH